MTRTESLDNPGSYRLHVYFASWVLVLIQRLLVSTCLSWFTFLRIDYIDHDAVTAPSWLRIEHMVVRLLS